MLSQVSPREGRTWGTKYQAPATRKSQRQRFLPVGLRATLFDFFFRGTDTLERPGLVPTFLPVSFVEPLPALG
jgi:hypothetical protein